MIFGEVLFDHFADGSRVLGGAPFNVAWHLRGFGLDPLVISAVGTDEPGDEALERMSRWRMRTEGVQLDPLHPTGRVAAKIVGGEPTFEIGTEQAYDFVDAAKAVAAIRRGGAPLIYHGSLALRGDRTWQALQSVLAQTKAPTFVDLNLRSPWWTLDRIRWCLVTSTWLKLSAEELQTVRTVSTVGAQEVDTAEACIRAAEALADAYDIATVLVTRGAKGSVLVAHGTASARGTASLADSEIVDTVGAGDAFSAVACIGVLEGWAPEQILGRGNAFAAALCGIRGATTEDRSLYEQHRRAWAAEP